MAGGRCRCRDRRLRVGAPASGLPAGGGQRCMAGRSPFCRSGRASPGYPVRTELFLSLVVGARRAAAQRLRRLLAWRRRPCGAAGRDAGRPGSSSGARSVGRAALHGLPEPVDRRFRCRPCAATCALLVRERLKAGDSDGEVHCLLVSRYGEFVLLKPRFDLRNALLWPPVLLIGAGGLFLWRRRRHGAAVAPLTAGGGARQALARPGERSAASR